MLIIDDEPLVLDAFSRMLEGNVKVVAACGGAEALAILARDEAFDAIVCDLMMPEMDGIEVFKQIAHRWPGLQDRVIFCTGGAFTPVAKDFLHAASNPWISKPVPWDTLLGLLEDLSSRGDTDDGGTPDG